MATEALDLSAAGKYPIVLSDALLGKTTKEVYTGIRYNHKADASPSATLSSMHISPTPSTPSTYNLSYTEDSTSKYIYQGPQTIGNGQFILIFDPSKQHFVLHRLDSTFDMNLISSPWNTDETSLREQYPQLSPPPSKPVPGQRKTNAKTTSKKTSTSATIPKPEPKKKTPQTKKAKAIPVREPTPEKTRTPVIDEDEDAEGDDDGDLEIEWGDIAPPSSIYTSAPVFPPPTTTIHHPPASESGSEADEDAEGEEYYSEEDGDGAGGRGGDNGDVENLTLPSPAHGQQREMSQEEIELDLDAELEQAFEEDGEFGDMAGGGGGGGDESSESEEE